MSVFKFPKVWAFFSYLFGYQHLTYLDYDQRIESMYTLCQMRWLPLRTPAGMKDLLPQMLRELPRRWPSAVSLWRAVAWAKEIALPNWGHASFRGQPASNQCGRIKAWALPPTQELRRTIPAPELSMELVKASVDTVLWLSASSCTSLLLPLLPTDANPKSVP